MAIDLDLLSEYNFRLTLQNYCEQLGWSISQIDNSSGTLKFKTGSGRVQTVFIVLFDQTIEFSVPTGIKFPSKDSIPGSLSTLLLALNSKNKVGFWCIEELNNQQVFSVMHNAELSLIDLDYFQGVILALVQRCDEIEQFFIRALNT